MSLPPKPEFSPGRYPPDYRGYARPPPPADRYRTEREIYPPRSRYPADPYVAPRPGDAYRAPRPSTDSYVTTYERRDDNRVRRDHRDHGREWRERGYPPPAEPRYADAGREREDWDRARRDDVRVWERRPEPRRGYDRESERRELTPPPRSRRPRPRERSRERGERSDRLWVPRQSKSPPRRIGVSTAVALSRPCKTTIALTGVDPSIFTVAQSSTPALTHTLSKPSSPTLT
ncbi:hypothetical protein C8Q72DRAFT_879360 [Fomitopsis betulina]|nr:hypothetical protein C8Q72DRAFT_879360 [Fomitopsis betulina]